ncbi:hypothetical protein SDC9_210249 [bioreactor metagenome]|uniref:Ribosomal RNA methyltransferase FtsJ domain-containing protein n=1 Tax=bioreactor metagenome TaxID=1076179 RepID=A0A645JHB6_9ZZZZ
MPVAFSFLKENGEIVALIKPQFEAGREKVGKKGVVRDPQTHMEVIDKIFEFVKQQCYRVKDLTFSPITGPEGNIEYLIYIKKELGEVQIDPILIDDIVRSAHKTLEVGNDEKNCDSSQ